jgi:hypothetical protein
MLGRDNAVQGWSREDRELLDAQALVGHLVPAGSVFAFLAEHRGELFPDEAFADTSGVVVEWAASDDGGGKTPGGGVAVAAGDQHQPGPTGPDPTPILRDRLTVRAQRRLVEVVQHQHPPRHGLETAGSAPTCALRSLPARLPPNPP